MTKGLRQSRNPVERLVSLKSQLENVVQAILDSASNPNFSKEIEELKKQIDAEESKKSNINKESREIMKLLQTYPGLSKQVLTFLKTRINDYTEINAIDKFKDDQQDASAKSTEPKKSIKKETKE